MSVNFNQAVDGTVSNLNKTHTTSLAYSATNCEMTKTKSKMCMPLQGPKKSCPGHMAFLDGQITVLGKSSQGCAIKKIKGNPVPLNL